MQQQSTAKLSVRVSPGASANVIAGWMGDQLKLRVSAAPEKGKANRAVIELLSRALGIQSGAIKISKGTTSSNKIVEIAGLSSDELYRRLGSGE